MEFVVFFLAFPRDYGLLAGESVLDAVEAGFLVSLGPVECCALARLAASLVILVFLYLLYAQAAK